MPASKYSREDVYVSPLKAEHAPLLPKFKSKNDGMNEFLQKDALEYQKLDLGATYLLLDKKGERIISYITMSMGALKIPERKEEFVFRGRRLGEYPKSFPQQFPSLLIGKLATDENEIGKGGAGILLELAAKTALDARKSMGCAFMVTHALAQEDVVGWYTHQGFKTHMSKISGETVPMYLELNPQI